MTRDIETELAHGQASHNDVVEFLVANHYAGVRHLALSLLNDAAEADDIAQKTMMLAADKISHYQPHTNLKAWVYKFAVNLAKTQLRKRTTRERFERFLPFERTMPTTPEDVAVLNERNHRLWQAVHTLPTKQRIPIVLRYALDMNTDEIADMLNVPHGTIRSRLHYAERKLHGILTAEEVTA